MRLMRSLAFIGLLGAVILSALLLVVARHESRSLFIQLQGLEKQRDVLDEEWGRLQLEQATWGAHARVEDMARNRLSMVTPSPDKVILVRP
jgi:cell division protein FtsL